MTCHRPPSHRWPPPPLRAAFGPAFRALYVVAAVAAVCAATLAGCGNGWSGSLGAVLGEDNHSGRLYVREVPDGLGAARAGLTPGDEILMIDATMVTGATPDAIRTALRGPVGSTLWLTVVHDGQTRRVQVERSPLK